LRVWLSELVPLDQAAAAAYHALSSDRVPPGRLTPQQVREARQRVSLQLARAIPVLRRDATGGFDMLDAESAQAAIAADALGELYVTRARLIDALHAMVEGKAP
jgi:hypothetical protein